MTQNYTHILEDILKTARVFAGAMVMIMQKHHTSWRGCYRVTIALAKTF